MTLLEFLFFKNIMNLQFIVVFFISYTVNTLKNVHICWLLFVLSYTQIIIIIAKLD